MLGSHIQKDNKSLLQDANCQLWDPTLQHEGVHERMGSILTPSKAFFLNVRWEWAEKSSNLQLGCEHDPPHQHSCLSYDLFYGMAIDLYLI